MEQLIRCGHPALIVAADHLIDLVDRVIERHHRKPKGAAHIKWSPLCIWDDIRGRFDMLDGGLRRRDSSFCGLSSRAERALIAKSASPLFGAPNPRALLLQNRLATMMYLHVCGIH